MNKNAERIIWALLGALFMTMCARCSAAIHGDTDSIPAEPRAFCTIAFPANYRTHQTSQDLLRALAVEPAFQELRTLTKVTTYAANDPDFRHRWAARLPQVRDGRPCLIISYGDTYTPQKLIYGRDVGPGGALSVDALAADLANRVLPNLRARLQQQPPEPQFAQTTPAAFQYATDRYSARAPYTTRYTYTYSYGRPGRIRIFRPRQPDCPDCVNPEVGPQNPTTDPLQPGPNDPIRPLIPDDSVTTFPPTDTTTPDNPVIPNNPELPPAPVEPPPPDPRIDEQQQQIDKQAETIKQLQQTINQLQSTIVNVQPAKDYAPDINSIRREVDILQAANAQQQKVNIVVEGLKQAQADQDKVNAELLASLKNVAEQRNTFLNQLTQVREELAIDYDKTAEEVANRLTHSATITTLDGTTKLQTKPLNEPLEFVQRQRGIK